VDHERSPRPPGGARRGKQFQDGVRHDSRRFLRDVGPDYGAEIRSRGVIIEMAQLGERYPNQLRAQSGPKSTGL
jgi:hypothetical protein